MPSDPLGTTIEDVLASVFGATPDTLFVVNPSVRVVEQYVAAASDEAGALPRTRLLADDGVLKGATADFLVASPLAGLVADDVLSLRTADDLPRASLLVTADRVVSLVDLDDHTGGIATTDPGFVDDVLAACERDWRDAAPYGLRTPPLARVRETLADDLGDDVAADFDALLAADDGLDEVEAALLAAAKNSVLLYDVSRWGEDVGLASKATFSRTKTRLEDAGLLTTEKVPIDVGRPRLRLLLADDALTGADAAALAETARRALA
ncbi:MAG: transcriptional regulator TbsP [Halarchaeum sp.]